MGVPVSRLKRVRYGPVMLPSRLATGRLTELGYDDLKTLYSLLNLPLNAARDPRSSRGKDADKGKSMLIPYPDLAG